MRYIHFPLILGVKMVYANIKFQKNRCINMYTILYIFIHTSLLFGTRQEEQKTCKPSLYHRHIGYLIYGKVKASFQPLPSCSKQAIPNYILRLYNVYVYTYILLATYASVYARTYICIYMYVYYS